jgi:cytoskeletal protein CcmA (bactofilin family)
MQTQAITITKTSTGYIYNGVNIKRTIIKNKTVFSFEVDMAGIVIDSEFKTLTAATQRIDASIGKRSGMFGVCTTTHAVVDGRLSLK